MKRLLFVFFSLFILLTVKADDIYEVTAARLNVRARPSSNATILGGLSQGDQIEVTEITNSGWAKFLYNNKIGYVSSKYLQLVQHIEEEVEPDLIEPEIIENEVKEEVVVQEALPVSYNYNEEFTTLLNGPFKISNNFELYYGLSAGAGYSSFMWDGGLVSGKVTYTADLFVELDIIRQQSYFKGCFFELQIGYDGKGAAWYPMNYMHLRLFPLGYKYNLNPIKLVGKAGIYMGFPLSDLESYDSGQYWSSDLQVGISASVGVEYYRLGISANVDYCFSEVAPSAPVSLNNIAIFGTISYKFGKFKH